ncbi:hypothetical protein EJ08DRAFT_657797 [Tothia fuscella]|uniref:HRDC domain-containing protein n=1 Tax=Tothia fuscella TaxID=1048955 RepID=A0A9P4U253_9PEZI|nr:hypothetical protein EJ08DRAFT_657797 [Tothia fuscella]
MEPPDKATATAFTLLQSTLKPALLSTTRATNALLAADLPFHRSLDPTISESLDEQNARLLQLAGRVLGNVEAGAEVVSAPAPSASSSSLSSNAKNKKGPSSSGKLGGGAAFKLEDGDDLDVHWKRVVDVFDSLLERADGALDEYSGSLRRGAAKANVIASGVEATNAVTTPATAAASAKAKWPKVLNILKPQRAFANVPLNDETGPFKPLLTYKPHAKVGLEESVKLKKDVDGTLKYQHPYQTEIDNYKFPPSLYMKTEPIPYLPYETTTATLVDTPEALAEMVAELKTAKEIAIDLEHHDSRTYIGIVCLMQISTRDKDWIVDTLKPWRRQLESLNEVFADPNILKVLHGSAMDMIWLQRDFGVYVVGMFDTGCAATVLKYPGRGLAYLLDRFVQFKAQKQHQLADWRVRPLGQDLFDYARADTHFLLYIYDCMRNELIETSNLSDPIGEGDLLQKVLEGSKELQLQRYEVPSYDAENGMGPMGWYKQLYKSPALFSKEQYAVFKALHQWRDNVARQEDDSIHFVMSNHAMMSLAREMPESPEKLVSATSAQTAAMKQRRKELVSLIVAAKANGESGPEMRDEMRKLDAIANEARYAERMANGKPAIVPFIPPPPPAPRSKTSVQKANSTSTPTIPRKRPALEEAVAPRAESSTFWGALLNGGQKRNATVDVRLNLPLPELTAEIFAVSSAQTLATSSPVADAGARAEHVYVPAAKRSAPEMDDVFVIRDMGGRSKKRKIADIEAAQIPTPFKKPSTEIDHNADELPLETPIDDDEKALRRARRKEKKAAKAAAKLMNGTPASSSKIKGEDGEEDEEQEAEPAFDYENAPSVYHAQNSRENREKRRKNGKPDRGIDPYKKQLDGPRGLPRAHKEKAGRSGTFKG